MRFRENDAKYEILVDNTGDEIFADPSSIVGSIGVVSASFGFPELMKKIGVERRVHTAGQNKAVLDPRRRKMSSG